jgi:hypothetical protein
MANFKGVADIIRGYYQKSIQPWDDNEPVDLTECRGCGGRGIRDGMEIPRLTAICRKSDCGPLENELVRLRAQIATLEEGNADLEEGRDNLESQYALVVKQLGIAICLPPPLFALSWSWLTHLTILPLLAPSSPLYPLYVLPPPSLAIRAKSSQEDPGFIYITGNSSA